MSGNDCRDLNYELAKTVTEASWGSATANLMRQSAACRPALTFTAPRCGPGLSLWCRSSISGTPATALLLASLAGPALADVISGTNGADVLYGTAEADTIRGYKGGDALYARAGDDTVYGGLGADRIYGRTGADRLHPGDDQRKDILRGGPGPDRINARTPDVVYAGAGNDTIRVLEAPDMDPPTIQCGPGRDTVIAPYTGFGMSNCERVIAP